MLLHDNKGIKDKFTPHTPYPAIVCLLGGPRVTRICHFNLLTSRRERRQGHSVWVSVQINEAESSRDEYPCMLSFRDEIFLAEACQHVCPLSLLINPTSFFRVKDLILSLCSLNSWIGYTQSQHSITSTTVGWTVRLDLKKKYWKLIVLVASSIVSPVNNGIMEAKN